MYFLILFLVIGASIFLSWLDSLMEKEMEARIAEDAKAARKMIDDMAAAQQEAYLHSEHRLYEFSAVNHLVGQAAWAKAVSGKAKI